MIRLRMELLLRMQEAGVTSTLLLHCTFCALQVNYTAFSYEVKEKKQIESAGLIFYSDCGSYLGKVLSV